MSVVVTYQNTPYTLEANETVLDGLLRHGVAAPYSCRSGACQACLMRAVQGVPPVHAQRGLKETQQTQGYFLACQCIPREDLEVGDAHAEISATVRRKEKLNAGVVRLTLHPHQSLDFRAGQYLQLVRQDGVIRSYSIASLPDEDIELHVEKVPGGVMSGWIMDEVEAGEEVKLRGPVGDCFYVPGNPDQPLLLAGTATGLAPLYGIVRDALRQGHRAPIYLFHGSTTVQRLYLRDELSALTRRYSQLHYQPCVLSGEAGGGIGEGIVVGDLQQRVLQASESFQGWRVYLCGNPGLVYALRKKIFLKGASNKEIFSDAFLQTKPIESARRA